LVYSPSFIRVCMEWGYTSLNHNLIVVQKKKKKRSGQQGGDYKGGLQYFILCFWGLFWASLCRTLWIAQKREDEWDSQDQSEAETEDYFVITLLNQLIHIDTFYLPSRIFIINEAWYLDSILPKDIILKTAQIKITNYLCCSILCKGMFPWPLLAHYFYCLIVCNATFRWLSLAPSLYCSICCKGMYVVMTVTHQPFVCFLDRHSPTICTVPFFVRVLVPCSPDFTENCNILINCLWI
jgi:hypothetical protein